MSPSRYRSFLLRRYRSFAGYLGVLLCIIGLITLCPAGLVLLYPAEMGIGHRFLWPGLLLASTGWLLWKCFRPSPDTVLSIAEGSIIVVFAWCSAILAGAVPFRLSGMDWTRALFEATSGWTTTGLSVVDIEKASPLILFHRSLMQLAGGAGLAVLMLSSMAGPPGVGLSAAEGREEQLVPHVRHSARMVLTLYGLYAFLGTAALKIAGMEWFDAVNHAFSAISTGGFSTHTESIAFWDSPGIEAVLIVLMMLGSINFLTAYTLSRGYGQPVMRNGEIRTATVVLGVSMLVLFFGVTGLAYHDTSRGIRTAVFQAVAALSTTGFAIVDFPAWNALGWLVIITLMLIGGGAGSTAGGIKQHRLYLLFRLLRRQVMVALLPRYSVSEESVWVGKHRLFLGEHDLWRPTAYIGLYLLGWLAGGCALAALGLPLADSLFEFASALGTVGLSTGLTSAASPEGQLWIQIAGMILGRLEFFVLFWGLAKFLRDLPALVGL